MAMHTKSFEMTNTAVREQYRNRCANCGAEGSGTVLDVHPIVPRGQAGSNLMSNQVILCRHCHDAAHGKRRAPTVQSMSTGEMDPETFDLFRRFWKDLVPVIGDLHNVPIEPIYREEDRC